MLPSRFTLITCFLVHIQAVFSSTWIISLVNKNGILGFHISMGISYLLYPVIGYSAEVCLTKLRMIKWSFVTLFLSSMTLLLTAILFMITVSSYELHFAVVNISPVLAVFIIVSGLAGLGMYEANAIQFGMDQMIEASSEQLSSFIHWYFWCIHIGPLIVFYILMVVMLYIRHCTLKADFAGNYTLGLLLLVISSIQIFSCAFGFLFTMRSQRYNCTKQTAKHSLQMVYKVLKYAYHHTHPEQRSALTYWENDVPTRIDLGKQKYGGPFTYEQVEDVKIFFRLLLVILSLFGFQFSGDGYSLTLYLMSASGCTTAVPLLLLLINPQHITLLVVSFGIPLFQTLKKYFIKYTPNMLTRLWVGLFLCLLNEAVQTIYMYSFTIHVSQKEFKCHEALGSSDPFGSITKTCSLANLDVMRNNSCDHYCSDRPAKIPFLYFSGFPLLLHGASYSLIFLTTLEFICAQSPTALKGLLIGIWYSMLSIKYIFINSLDTYPPNLESLPWNIYHLVKGFGIFLSIIAFSIVCKQYRYRERNEVVNEQAIIEEQYERELLNNSSDDSDRDLSDD